MAVVIIGTTYIKTTHSVDLPSPEMEFVCYDDGRLVERHIMVEHASHPEGSPMWHLNYTDGQQADYNQPAGEACGLEIAYGEV